MIRAHRPWPHGLGRLEGEPADEDRQAPEQAPVSRIEQVVAPGDGVADGLLPRGQVARAAAQQRAGRSLICGQQRLRREDLHRAAASSMASGNPSRCRQSAATVAALVSVEREVRADRPGRAR